jgi:SHS2 domain-containing protein
MATLMSTAIVTIEAREVVATAAAMATAAVTPNAKVIEAVTTPSMTADVDVSIETMKTSIEEAMTAAGVILNADVATTIDGAMKAEAAHPAQGQLTMLKELLDVEATKEMAPPRQAASELANNVATKREEGNATVPKAASAALLDLEQRKEFKAQLVFPRRTKKCPLQ